MISLIYSVCENEAKEKVLDSLNSGKAFLKMKEWISAQGGNVDYIENTDIFPKTKYTFDVLANDTGYISYMDTEKIGITSVILGAGRASKEDEIDLAAGLEIFKKTGDRVEKGERISTFYTNRECSIPDAEKIYNSAVIISKNRPENRPLIFKKVK